MSGPVPPDPGPAPENWDLLRGPDPDEVAAPAPPQESVDRMAVIAAAWGDLVALATVVTAALATVLALGASVTLIALPWAAVLALAWWSCASSLLLVVRRATPGMLMAGVVLAAAPRGRSLVVALAAALAGALTLGLAAWPFGRRPLIAVLVGTEVVPVVDSP